MGLEMFFFMCGWVFLFVFCCCCLFVWVCFGVRLLIFKWPGRDQLKINKFKQNKSLRGTWNGGWGNFSQGKYENLHCRYFKINFNCLWQEGCITLAFLLAVHQINLSFWKAEVEIPCKDEYKEKPVILQFSGHAPFFLLHEFLSEVLVLK